MVPFSSLASSGCRAVAVVDFIQPWIDQVRGDHKPVPSNLLEGASSDLGWLRLDAEPDKKRKISQL